ncbi:MAG: NAD-dependent deacylase [Myxococcota bacterium]|jgi:NAD-dependent deacetylase
MSLNLGLLNGSTIEEVADLVAKNGRLVALTGAGISVESGIPDFRSDHGLWTRFDPMEYATMDAFRRDPVKVWRLFRELSELEEARPNEGHAALKVLEDLGYLQAIITQNIDSLHSRAGNTNVIELHGSTRRLRCIECGTVFPRCEMPAGEVKMPPVCDLCGGLVKPDVILFGEPLPEDALNAAREAAAGAAVLITVGTSGLVSPANIIPRIAKDSGAFLVEVNIEETVLTSSVTDYFLRGSSSQVLPRLARRLRAMHQPHANIPW